MLLADAPPWEADGLSSADFARKSYRMEPSSTGVAARSVGGTRISPESAWNRTKEPPPPNASRRSDTANRSRGICAYSAPTCRPSRYRGVWAKRTRRPSSFAKVAEYDGSPWDSAVSG